MLPLRLQFKKRMFQTINGTREFVTSFLFQFCQPSPRLHKLTECRLYFELQSCSQHWKGKLGVSISFVHTDLQCLCRLCNKCCQYNLMTLHNFFLKTSFSVCQNMRKLLSKWVQFVPWVTRDLSQVLSNDMVSKCFIAINTNQWSVPWSLFVDS